MAEQQMVDLLEIGDARIKEIFEFDAEGKAQAALDSLKRKFEAAGLEHLSDEDFLLNLLSVQVCFWDGNNEISIYESKADGEMLRKVEVHEILDLYSQMKQEGQQDISMFLRSKGYVVDKEINGIYFKFYTGFTIEQSREILIPHVYDLPVKKYIVADLTVEEINFIQSKMTKESELEVKIGNELKDKCEKYFFDVPEMNETGTCVTSSILHFLSYEKMDKVINKAIEFFLKYPQLYFRMDSDENFSPKNFNGMLVKIFRFCQVALGEEFVFIDGNYLEKHHTINVSKNEDLVLEELIGFKMIGENEFLCSCFDRNLSIDGESISGLIVNLLFVKKVVNAYLQAELCDKNGEDYPMLTPSKLKFTYGNFVFNDEDKPVIFTASYKTKACGHRTSIRNAKDMDGKSFWGAFNKDRFLSLQLFQKVVEEGDKFSRERNKIIGEINNLFFEGEEGEYENIKKWFEGKVALENEVVCKNCFRLLDEFFINRAEFFRRTALEAYGLQIKFFKQCIENAGVDLNGLSFPLHEIKNGEDESFWQEYNDKVSILNEKLDAIRNIFSQIQNLDKAIDDYYANFKKQFQITTMKEIFPFIEEDFLAQKLYEVGDLLNLKMKMNLLGDDFGYFSYKGWCRENYNMHRLYAKIKSMFENIDDGETQGQIENLITNVCEYLDGHHNSLVEIEYVCENLTPMPGNLADQADKNCTSRFKRIGKLYDALSESALKVYRNYIAYSVIRCFVDHEEKNHFEMANFILDTLDYFASVFGSDTNRRLIIQNYFLWSLVRSRLEYYGENLCCFKDKCQQLKNLFADPEIKNAFMILDANVQKSFLLDFDHMHYKLYYPSEKFSQIEISNRKTSAKDLVWNKLISFMPYDKYAKVSKTKEEMTK